VRTCFVTSFYRATQLESVEPPLDVVYREGGTDTFCIPGNVREAVHEVLFEQDNDQTSISTMILDAIIKAKYFSSISLTIFISKLSSLEWAEQKVYQPSAPLFFWGQYLGSPYEHLTFACQSSSSSDNNSSQFKRMEIWENFHPTPKKETISKKCMHACIIAVSLYCHLNLMLWLNCTQCKQ
jgi:hypothetical protein